MENETVLSLVSAEAVLAAVSCVFLQFSVLALNKSLPRGHVHLHRSSSVGKKIYVLLAQEKKEFYNSVKLTGCGQSWPHPSSWRDRTNQKGTFPIVTLVYESSLDIAKDSFKLPCRPRNGSKVPRSRAVWVSVYICNPICIYLWEQMWIFTSSSAKQLAFFFFLN